MTDTGYIQDVPYTWSFFNYQAPLHLSYVARINGFPVRPLDQPFTYCDLGCGNGVTVNLLADALPQGDFYGVDFNPDHVNSASSYAKSAGLTNSFFIDNSFEDYLQSDPPMFDFITLHGIYSWVNAEVRQQVRAVIDRTLKPEGLVYVSYNTLPGWAELMPMWKMMRSYTAGMELDSVSTAQEGLKYLKYLRDNDANYFRTTPSAEKYLDRLLKRDLFYVAHEFCSDWFEPQYFTDVANEMNTIGLTYAGTSRFHRNWDKNVISSRFKEHVEEADDRQKSEERRSFLRNEFFRRDVYFRGDDSQRTKDIDTAFGDLVIGPGIAESRIKRQVHIGRRKVNFKTSLYDVLIPVALKGKYSVDDICSLPELESHTREDILQAIHELVASEQFEPQARKVTALGAGTKKLTLELVSAMNRFLLEQRLVQDGKCYLASPVTGSAMRLNFLPGIFVQALDGRTEAQAKVWAEETLLAIDGKLLKEYKIRKGVVNHEWIEKEFERFRKRYLSRLKKFEILREKG